MTRAILIMVHHKGGGSRARVDLWVARRSWKPSPQWDSQLVDYLTIVFYGWFEGKIP
jgi:hypothetical protein